MTPDGEPFSARPKTVAGVNAWAAGGDSRAAALTAYDVARSGAVAEWLRSGLQSRVHRFDSGRRLLSEHSDAR